MWKSKRLANKNRVNEQVFGFVKDGCWLCFLFYLILLRQSLKSKKVRRYLRSSFKKNKALNLLTKLCHSEYFRNVSLLH